MRKCLTNEIQTTDTWVKSMLTTDTWVTDEPLNQIFYLLRSMPMSRRSRFHFQNSHFYIKLTGKVVGTKCIESMDYNYNEVQRWTSEGKDGVYLLENLFEFELAFYPINYTEFHWALLVVYFKEQKIRYFDSIHSSNTEFRTKRAKTVVNFIFQYLQDEMKDKLNGAIFPRE
jgi:Ulp1 family protease